MAFGTFQAPASPGQSTATTSSGINQSQRIIEMDKKIHELEPDEAPLTVLLSAMKKSTVTSNPEYNWLEGTLAPKTTADSGVGAAAGAVTVNVTAGDGLKIATNDIIVNPATGEHLLVTAIATDALTVTRGYGTTAAAAIAASQVLLVIGNANAEGASLRRILTQNLVKKTNYTQIFRTPCGATRTLNDSNLYGGTYMDREHRMKGIDHRVELERSFMFGEAKEDLTGATPRRTTAGVNALLTSNLLPIDGPLTYAAWVDMMQQAFRYGNKSMRFGYAAPIVLSSVDLMAYNKQLQMQESSIAGVSMKKVQSSHGTVILTKAVILSETNAYNERIYLLDMDTISTRPFVNAKTKLLVGRQANDVDGMIDEYLTEIGFQLENQEASACATGITAG